MDQSNKEYLQKSLKYLGFGEKLNPILESKMAEGKDNFKIGISTSFPVPTKKSIDNVDYELSFSKSNASQYYFLNSLRTSLKNQNFELSKVFPLGKGTDVTAKEAYNLLSGRSIMKQADIKEKFLLYLNSPDQESQRINSFSSYAEIKDSIKSIAPDPSSSFDIYYKNQKIRSLDSEGAFYPIEQKNPIINISYLDSSNKQGSVLHLADDFPSALATIQKIASSGLPHIGDSKITSFNVSHPESKIPLAQFDEKGNEISLTPESRKEQIWIKLDEEHLNSEKPVFKRFYQNYGFDLESEIQSLNIKELENPSSKEILMASLGRGNLQKVTVENNPFFIEADPQFKRLKVYDSSHQEISLDNNSRKI